MAFWTTTTTATDDEMTSCLHLNLVKREKKVEPFAITLWRKQWDVWQGKEIQQNSRPKSKIIALLSTWVEYSDRRGGNKPICVHHWLAESFDYLHKLMIDKQTK